MDTLQLSIAQLVPLTEAEGPGLRFALWFQGCPLRCPGCCNPEMLPFTGGQSMSFSQLVSKLDAACTHGIEGITLLGGEPFAHAKAAVAIALAARNRGLSIMIFSGYRLQDITQLPDPARDLLLLADLLVDGPYIRDLPDRTRRWIGSTNQRIHFLTDRYRPDDPCWAKRNTIEIRLDQRSLSLNGFPAESARALWRDLPRNNARSAS